MQNRRTFVKTACGLAACSCCAATLLAQEGQAGQPQEAPVDVGKLKRKMAASERRFAWLLEIMDAQLSKKAKAKLLEALGRRCAGEYAADLADKHKGDLKGFLDEARTLWIAEVQWADDGKSFEVFDKPQPCTCVLVGAGSVSSTLCACSVGFQKEMYSRVAGGPVQVTVEKSVLRGDPQCAFRVRLGKGD